MDEDARQDYEDRIIEEALERDSGKFGKLFKLALESSQGMGVMLHCLPEPDCGYAGEGGRNNPENEFTVDAWTLYIHEGLTELVGGADDGAEVFSGYAACLDRLLEAIRNEAGGLPSIEFCCEVGLVGLLGVPHVSICGEYQGLHVTVCLLAQPPDDIAPSMRMNEQGHYWRVSPSEQEDEDDQ